MDIDKAFGKLYEEVKIDEAKEFWAIIDKAKGGEVMAISSDEKGAKSSVKMSNFSKHDYHFGKDPRTLKIVKVAGSYKQGEKMIGTKLSFKEDVEKEARTYKDRADDDEKEKKKKHFAFGGKKKSRHGESGYGKGEEVEVDEGKYRGYDIKKQSRKDGHPLIVPALRISGANMKDMKRMIDKEIEKNPKLKIEEIELDEMFFRITIPDLPPVFVEGDSGSKIRRSMKLKLRPDVYKDLDVERVSRADMAKKYRSLAKAEKEKEEEDDVKEGLDEVAPPGWEGTIKKMKGDKNIDNPWALAWWMKSKGYKPNANEEVWHREQKALEEDFVSNNMGAGNIQYRSPLLFSKKKQKLVKRKHPAGTMMAYEEVELEEAFSMGKGDKRVVDAFYDQKTIKKHGASILTTDGKTLTKTGMGGQDIAKWVNGKIKIVAVSDVKSTELILKYMKKSIPSGVFEEVEEASTYRDKQRDDEKKKKKHFAFGGKKDKIRHGSSGYGKGYEEVEVKITESTTTDKKNTFGMAPFKDLKGVADAALKIMQGQIEQVPSLL